MGLEHTEGIDVVLGYENDMLDDDELEVLHKVLAHIDNDAADDLMLDDEVEVMQCVDEIDVCLDDELVMLTHDDDEGEDEVHDVILAKYVNDEIDEIDVYIIGLIRIIAFLDDEVDEVILMDIDVEDIDDEIDEVIVS